MSVKLFNKTSHLGQHSNQWCQSIKPGLTKHSLTLKDCLTMTIKPGAPAALNAVSLVGLVKGGDLGFLNLPSSVATTTPSVGSGRVAQASTRQSPTLATEAQQKAQKSVLKLVDADSGGSGVVVARQGNQYLLLTNQHCVPYRQKKPGGTVSIELPNGKVVTGKVVVIGNREEPNGPDLALVQFTTNVSVPVAKISKTPPAPGEAMFAIGFPFTGRTTSTHNRPGMRVDAITGATVAEGKVTRILSEEQQSRGEYGVVCTSVVIQGMSGGGTFNAAGELIGISGRSAEAAPIPLPGEDQDSLVKKLGPGAKSLAISVHEIQQFYANHPSKIPTWARF